MFAAPDPAVLIEGDRRDLLRFWLGVKVGVPGSNLLHLRLLSASRGDPGVGAVRLGGDWRRRRLVRSYASRASTWMLRNLVAPLLRDAGGRNAPSGARICGSRPVSPRRGMRSGDRALGLWVCCRLRLLGRFALLLALSLTCLLLVSRLGLGACGQRQQAGYHYRLKSFHTLLDEPVPVSFTLLK